MYPTVYANYPKMFLVSDTEKTPGERLRELRERLGLSARKVEKLSDPRVTHSNIGKIESGRTPWENVQLSTIKGLARAYGMTQEELLAEVSGMSSKESKSSQHDGRFTPGDRLKKIREDKDLTLEHVAELSGNVVSTRRLRNLEERKGLWQKVTEDEATALAKAYGMGLMDFLNTVNGTPYPSKPNIYTDTATYEGIIADDDNMIPEYDLLKAGPGGRGGDIIGFVNRARGNGEQIAYRVSGDSMSPEFKDNDTVIIRVQNYASPRNNIVCWTPDDGTMIKHLKDIRDDGTYVLTSINPDYPPIWTKEIHIFGVVVQLRKNYDVINGNH